MIRTGRFYRHGGYNPYENLAIEEYLLGQVGDGDIILYLWQNRSTVVIGKNQLHLKECRVKALEADGGYLARRLSGGGAVYHDDGNLNFTFLTKREDYDVGRQLDVIVAALAGLDIAVAKSGRNDLVLAKGDLTGRKFSGNAFYYRGDRCYHHGTIMLNVDSEKLARYLRPSRAKLVAKGVDSVRTRVANLRQLRPDLTVDELSNALYKAFAHQYDVLPTGLSLPPLTAPPLAQLAEKYASPAWKYGENRPYTVTVNRRFAWGELALACSQRAGATAVTVYSDAMDSTLIEAVAAVLAGQPLDGAALAAALKPLQRDYADATEPQAILADIENFLRRQDF